MFLVNVLALSFINAEMPKRAKTTSMIADLRIGWTEFSSRKWFRTLVVGGKPAEPSRQLHHARANRRLVGIARKLEVARTCSLVARDAFERPGDRGHVALGLAQRCGIFLDVVEEHAHFRHLAAHELMDESDFLRSRQAIIGEMADVLPKARVRVRIAQAG